MRNRLFVVILALGVGAWAQVAAVPGVSGAAPLSTYSGAPTGSCSANAGGVDTTTGNFYTCNGGSWIKVGPGAAVPTTIPVNAQTASYAVAAGDFSAGKIITVNDASASTVTLLATAPTAGQYVYIENIGAGAVTVANNTRNIDGAAASLTLNQNQGVLIDSDGTNYVTNRGIGGGASASGASGTIQLSNGSSALTSVTGFTFATTTLTLPAGGVITTPDTGNPSLTFGANLITINQPLKVTGTASWIGGAPGTAATPAAGNNYLNNASSGWTESIGSAAALPLMQNPFTTLGDVLYAGAAGAATRLAGNTTASAECLQETGTGSAAQAPTWAACGSGSGTVNNGTQYQLGYYATTGSTITGDANIVTDASNNLSAAGKLTAGATAASTLCDGGTGGCIGGTEGTAPTDATAGADRLYADSTCHCIKGEYNSTTAYAIPQTIATGTATLATAAISAGTCATVVTVAGAGIATTDAIVWSFNATPGTGYTAGLDVKPYVTAGNVNFLVCNPTAGSLTPAAATLNWAVRR